MIRSATHDYTFHSRRSARSDRNRRGRHTTAAETLRAAERVCGKTTARWALTLDDWQQHYECQQPNHHPHRESFGPGFLGLTGSMDELRQAAKSFKVKLERIQLSEDPTDYVMKHASPIFVMWPTDPHPRPLRAGGDRSYTGGGTLGTVLP
jgi:hypothetical protein